MLRFGEPLDPAHLAALAGHPEQLLGAELSERGDGAGRGVRVLTLRGPEVTAEVIVDRALDLGRAWIRGVPVAWLSPTGLVGPWYREPHGFGTQRTFAGGLMTTCGLDHVGLPAERSAARYEHDPRGADPAPLHGRVSTVPAELRGYGLDTEGRPFAAGEVRQASLFGEVLLLARRITLDGRCLLVEDAVRNAGYAPTPHAILYHVNAGWPLVAPDARVLVPGGDYPVPLSADARGADPTTVTAPGRDNREQVWLHRLPAEDGPARAAVLNPDLGDGRAVGLALNWDRGQLPGLLQWQVMGDGNYVVGLEPTSARAENGKPLAIPELAPGEERRYGLELRLLWGAEVGAELERAETPAAG